MRAPRRRSLSLRRLYVLVFVLAAFVVPVLPTSAAIPAPAPAPALVSAVDPSPTSVRAPATPP